jgi:hypothetical protein
MTDQQQRINRGRRKGARFRDDSKLGVLGGPAEVADRLRAEWEDPVLLAKLAVLDDPTLDEERHQRVVREVAESAQVDGNPPMAHPWHIHCSTERFVEGQRPAVTSSFGSPAFHQVHLYRVREAQAWGDPGHPRPGHRSRICWKSSSGCRASNSSAGSTTKYP